MQLLQKLRDSSVITEFSRSFEKIEKIAREHYRFIRDFLNSSLGEPLILVYTGLGHLPAHIVYWYVLTMREEQFIVFSEAQVASHYILPYREKASILAFAAGEHSSMFSVMRVARLLGHHISAMVSKPNDDRMETILRDQGALIISLDGELESSLAMALSSFMALAEVFKEGLQARGRRLLEHSTEGFAAISKSLVNRYIDILEKILLEKKVIITSSKLMESSSTLLTRVLRINSVDAYYVPLEVLDTINMQGDVLIVTTSVEEKIARNLKYRLLRAGINTVDLVFNTDPLEANIYLSMLVYYIEKLKSNSNK